MYGLNRFARGLRSADPALAVAGLAIAVLGYVRSRHKSDRKLLYSRELKPGEELHFRLAD